MSGARGLVARLCWLAFGIVSIAAALTARVIWEGESELAASNSAFNRGEIEPSLEHARRSATLYAPGAPHVERAYERLFAIATGAEAAAEPKVAYLAWQAVRSAALESRHLWLPRQAELDRANRNLARLEVVARGTDDTQRSSQQARALGTLEADEGPAPAWIGVLSLGFTLALTGFVVAAVRGSDSSGRFSFQRAFIGLLLAAIGAACWTFAALKA